jgi:Rod binding domain-containing protein
MPDAPSISSLARSWPIDAAARNPGADPRLSEAQRSFAGVLARAAREPSATPESAARESAEQLVSVAFVQPMLKLVRDTNRAAPPWAPTPGEKMFGGLADAELAQRLVHASRFPIVERLTRDLLARVGGERAPIRSQVLDAIP